MGGMHSGTTGMGNASGTSSTGGFGGAPSCDMLACGFKKQEPLAGCMSCAESMHCKDQSNACDAECQEFKTCIGNCDLTDDNCITMCQSMFPAGASLFDAFLQCAACTVCASPCAGSPVMTLAMCGGAVAVGAGGAGGAGGAPKP
jgi:hypothetical protein